MFHQTSPELKSAWKKERDIFIDDNKKEIYGIFLVDIYSCIDSSTQHCMHISWCYFCEKFEEK